LRCVGIFLVRKQVFFLAALSITAIAGIPECRIVEGDRIVLRDLAGMVPEFRAADAEASIGYSPVPGATRLVSAAEMARIASAHRVKLPGPISACFKRKVQALDAEVILRAMKAAIPEASIELVEFSRSPVPIGEVEFPADRLGRPPAGNRDAPVLWRGVVKDGGRSYPIWARVKVAGPPEAVTRGARVSVRALAGTAQLTFEATAESAGRPGEMVLVRNPWNGRRFRGRVEAEGKVVVE
jgi:hypothetical protein